MECVSARNSEGEEVSNTPEAKNLLKYFDSPKNERKVEDLKPGWTKFQFRLEACSVPDGGAHVTSLHLDVTLLHLVMLHQDFVMLQCLIEDALEKGYLGEKIKFTKVPNDFRIVEDDQWLFDANCLHLASKYFPEGLNLLLSEGKVKEKAKELIDAKTRVDKQHEPLTQNKGCFPFCCPKEIHPEAQTKEIVEIAPLHIAAKKPDSISTR